jgi:prevent-host-death family protein
VKVINVYEARAHLSKLLEAAEAGEEVIIARNGTPVVRLVPITAPERRLGRWQGQVPSVSAEQWAASDDAVAEVFADSVT